MTILNKQEEKGEKGEGKGNKKGKGRKNNNEDA